MSQPVVNNSIHIITDEGLHKLLTLSLTLLTQGKSTEQVLEVNYALIVISNQMTLC